MRTLHASHERLTRDEEVKGSSDRAFGFVIAAVLLIVGLWPLMAGESVGVWSLVIAAAFLVVGLVRPAILAPLNRLWIRLGLLLARFASPVVMAIMFYLVVTPMGLVARLFGKDLLRLRLDRSAKSYWIERRPPGPAPDTMKNQF